MAGTYTSVSRGPFIASYSKDIRNFGLCTQLTAGCQMADSYGETELARAGSLPSSLHILLFSVSYVRCFSHGGSSLTESIYQRGGIARSLTAVAHSSRSCRPNFRLLRQISLPRLCCTPGKQLLLSCGPDARNTRICWIRHVPHVTLVTQHSAYALHQVIGCDLR